jgi:hypothetical protein
MWLRGLLRPLLKGALTFVAGIINGVTEIKQPGPPYLRSPFLKLSAVFESWILEVDARVEELLAVGDRVMSSSGASGVIACSPTVAGHAEERDNRRKHSTANQWTECRLVLTQVDGVFEPRDVLAKQHSDPSSRNPQFGRVRTVSRGTPWYDSPAFFIHAGDQIYYDFPDVYRQPDRKEYRLAYREAWFEDDAKRHLLSHWPHYTTLDDHEIADQFANDFWPRLEDVLPRTYLEEATVAYREYAHAMNPPPRTRTDEARQSRGPFWYKFDKGCTRFFVLDTRTQRFNGPDNPQIIDDAQMCELLKWMTDYKNDLKFVVTSVSFVAQVNEARSEQIPRWNKRPASEPGQPSAGAARADPSDSKEQRLNSENDKWSSDRFERQRSQIIDHIAEHSVEHLVFLAGDMHCCYHATMRITPQSPSIGPRPKYESITVHELAGGPVNQLQMADAGAFEGRCPRRTSRGVVYEVALERFHGDVNAVLHLKVEYVNREQITGQGRVFTPEIEWNVIRTLTDTGASAWADNADPARPQAVGEPVMAGRISFARKRTVDELCKWPVVTASSGA